MNEFQVNCTNKPDRMNSHEHITHVGNTLGNWKLTREEVIRRIEANEEAFYTINASTDKKVYIGVYREVGKVPYLRTHADAKWERQFTCPKRMLEWIAPKLVTIK